jgi:flagella synthesis protein FlgN
MPKLLLQTPADSLADEFTALTRLHELLQAEKAMLIANTIDGLPELIRDKATQIAEITVLADARHRCLVTNGLEASEIAMQSWIDSSGAESEKQHWSQLLDLARDVKEQNRVNGILVNRHMQSNQQVMSLFEGKSNSFYGPDGQSNIKASARKIGIA